MRKTKTTKFDGKEITVKELTVKDISRLLSSFDTDAEMHPVDLLFNDSFPALGISMSTGLTLDDLQGDIAPSDLDLLITEVKNINPFLVKLIQKLLVAGKAAGAKTGTAKGPKIKD